MWRRQLLDPYFPINKNLWTSTYRAFLPVLCHLCWPVHWISDFTRVRKVGCALSGFWNERDPAYALAAIVSETSIYFEFAGAGGRAETLTCYTTIFSFALPESEECFACLRCVFFVALILALLGRLPQKNICPRVRLIEL